jgi:hypothetical protein
VWRCTARVKATGKIIEGPWCQSAMLAYTAFSAAFQAMGLSQSDLCPVDVPPRDVYFPGDKVNINRKSRF